MGGELLFLARTPHELLTCRRALTCFLLGSWYAVSSLRRAFDTGLRGDAWGRSSLSGGGGGDGEWRVELGCSAGSYLNTQQRSVHLNDSPLAHTGWCQANTINDRNFRAKQMHAFCTLAVAHELQGATHTQHAPVLLRFAEVVENVLHLGARLLLLLATAASARGAATAVSLEQAGNLAHLLLRQTTDCKHNNNLLLRQATDCKHNNNLLQERCRGWPIT